jgi:hypothetical protein
MMLHFTNHNATVQSVTREQPLFIDGAGQSGAILEENTLSRQLYALGEPYERGQFTLSLFETELFNI